MKKLSLSEIKSRKYGKLTAISEALPEEYSNGHAKARKIICQCDCGKITTVTLPHLRTGHTTSCGCYNMTRDITHGLRKHPIYNVWDGINQRCNNSNNPSYKDYGGRGVKVYPDWRANFQTFYDWAMANGWERGLQLDRIDTNGNYEPSNCRFVTPFRNVCNRRVTVLNEETVQKIKKLRAETGWGSKKIATTLGLTVGSVGGVIYAKTWGAEQ